MGLNKPIGQTFIVILLAIASYQLLHESRNSNTATRNSDNNQIDKPSAFISNGEFTIYDKNGRATHFLSDKARYYSNPRRILIDSPAISFTTKDKQTITLNAKEGVFYPKQEKLFLKGNVIIQQLPFTPPELAPPATLNNANISNIPKIEHDAWTIESKEFELNNQTHFISTDQAVTMTNGKSSIRAIGLNAWIDEKKIELLSEVQGHYEFN